MSRLGICILLAASICYAEDSSAVILKRARLTVAQQLVHAWNYTCVETVQRDYFTDERANEHGCRTDQPEKPKGKHYKRDRLRLDVAVSEANEIFSWHGEDKFTSSVVTQVVRNGPISSGSFFGLITNVFILPGTQFAYVGKDDSGADRFEYSVPLAASRYTVENRRQSAIIDFHGTFTVEGPDSHLKTLQIISGAIPERIHTCLVKNSIVYQRLNIAGQLSLIPVNFTLNVLDNDAIYTISHSELSQCREFHAESAVRFQISDPPAAPAPKQSSKEEWLPSGLLLRIRLRKPVDDRTSFVGDIIEGVLRSPVTLPGTGRQIPKDAVLTGMITNLEQNLYPDHNQLFNARFTRVQIGDQVLRLNASLGNPVVGQDAHLHLGGSFVGEWITSKPPSTGADPLSQ